MVPKVPTVFKSLSYSIQFFDVSQSPTSTTAVPANLTPAMRQYFDAKRQYRHALLFFRMGDFYEMFYEDALVASRALDLTLTSRSKDASGTAVPMCGVPYHAADGYIARLLRKGYKVAICDQTEAAQKGVKLVRREVTRIVTPGTITDTNVLNRGENNFLLALADQNPGADGESSALLGAALLDVSTGEFRASQFSGPDRWSRHRRT